MATKGNTRSGAKTLKSRKHEIKDVTSKQASRVKGGALSTPTSTTIVGSQPRSKLLV